MTDLDIDLSNRLARLAAAVPTAQLDPVHLRAVEARQRVRMAWVTPLVFIVLVALLTTVLSIGPFGPGSVGNGPVSATTREGDFELTIRSGRARYGTDEPIEIVASLVYLGPEPAAQIEHSALVDDGPIGFGVDEPVMGGRFTTIDLLMAGRTTLKRGEPLVVPFAEGATIDGNDPRAADFRAFVELPGFRLPPGTWHPYAAATLAHDGTNVHLAVRVQIEVEAAIDATPAPFVNGPVTATAVDDQFELVIRSARARYAPGESIDIAAGVSYLADAGSIEIGHGLGAGGSALGFGIEEPVVGDLRLSPGWDLACVRSTLNAGIPVAQPFWKSASWSSTNPRADEYHRFVVDPELRLPVGTWHVFAVAEFSVGDCSASVIRLRADIVIEVAEDVAPSTPMPTEALPSEPPENAGLENMQLSDSGDYRIEIRSDKRIYRESEAVQITGILTYRGDSPIEVQDFRPLVFSIAEPVHGIIMDGAVTLGCRHTRLEPGQRIESPFQKSGGISTLDPLYEQKRAYLQDPIFRLPPGSYHVRVGGWSSEGPCGTGQDRFSTEIEITVLPDDATRMELLTYPERLQMCRSNHHQGRLMRDPDSGLGIELPSGELQSVLWPFRYSAWDTAEGAVLVDDIGRTVAVEGQLITFDGMDEPGWLVGAWCNIKGIVLTDADLP